MRRSAFLIAVCWSNRKRLHSWRCLLYSWPSQRALDSFALTLWTWCKLKWSVRRKLPLSLTLLIDGIRYTIKQFIGFPDTIKFRSAKMELECGEESLMGLEDWKKFSLRRLRNKLEKLLNLFSFWAAKTAARIDWIFLVFPTLCRTSVPGGSKWTEKS